MAAIVSVKGMHDTHGAHIAVWQHMETVLRETFAAYGYNEWRTPIVEHTGLFVRSIGEATDIVEKELYTFTDRSDTMLSLRPECTAGLVRAFNASGLGRGGVHRIWQIGAAFRCERPQKGRYRQFHQADCEVFGAADPEIDAELIAMTAALWQRFGLQNVTLHINSLGNGESRRAHRTALIAYLSAHKDILDATAAARLTTNPLRILDSKTPSMQAMLSESPKLIDFLDDESRAHFDTLRTLLDALGIAYTVDHRLVRGLDYYNRTVFEWTAGDLGAQATVCGGGRYDGLAELLGGRHTPAIGFAIGLERLALLLDATAKPIAHTAPDVLVSAAIESIAAVSRKLQVCEYLRARAITAHNHIGTGNRNKQLQKAKTLGARCVLCIDTPEEDTVLYIPVHDAGQQMRLSLADACDALRAGATPTI